MENFTPESLKKFVNQRELPQTGPAPPGEAKSARGQRVSEVLRSQRGPGQGQGQPESDKNLDTLIRKNMGELVRKYVQAGKLPELKVIMEEHRGFIDEILSLVENSMKK